MKIKTEMNVDFGECKETYSMEAYMKYSEMPLHE
jgi:hypothetical protein